MKVCRKCGIEKPDHSFPMRSKGYREDACGMCKKRAYIARHPEYAKNEAIRRRARAKGISVSQYLDSKGQHRKTATDPLYIAQRDRLRIEGLIVRKNQKRRCPILSAYPKIEYKINREYHLARCQEWGRKNPDKSLAKKQRRRARLAGCVSTLSLVEWQEIKRAFNHRCAYCQRVVKLTRDHVVPLSRGGDDTPMNVVPACRSCNASKSTGPPPRPVQTRLFV